jgi:hypothetical protein
MTNTQSKKKKSQYVKQRSTRHQRKRKQGWACLPYHPPVFATQPNQTQKLDHAGVFRFCLNFSAPRVTKEEYNYHLKVQQARQEAEAKLFPLQYKLRVG